MDKDKSKEFIAPYKVLYMQNLLLMDDYWTNNIQEYQNMSSSEGNKC